MELRAFTVADILDAAVECFWSKALYFISSALIVQAPPLLAGSAYLKTLSFRSAVTFQNSLKELVSVLPFFFLSLCAYTLAKWIVTMPGRDLVTGEKGSFRGNLRALAGKLPSLALYSALLLCIAALFIAVPLLVAESLSSRKLAYNDAMLAVLLALALSGAAALWFSVRSCLVIPAMVAEGRGFAGGLRRSWHLTGSMGAKALIVWISLHGLVIGTAVPLLSLFPLAGMLYVAAFLPVTALGELFLYYDSVVWQEAYDLVLCARSLQKGAVLPDGGI
ncbi:MAG: hypothetical protein RDV48_16680 [Candidatus Eremiobacteraeota bacterium]|nr:hypothetical protein [Candidatus Eremiobacteraeota bacterium]